MKWCVQFPEEEIVIKRPSLKRACCGNDSAAALLSYLLYRASISPAYKNQTQPAHWVEIKRTQREIIEEMDHEISERTLRSSAIPVLVALGYLRVQSQERTTTYLLALDAIQEGITYGGDEGALVTALKRQAASDMTVAHEQQHFRRLAATLPGHSGNPATFSRQHCRSTEATLPEHSGNPADQSGYLAASQNRSHSASQESSLPVSEGAKNQKKNQDSLRREEERPPSSAADRGVPSSRSAAETTAAKAAVSPMAFSHPCQKIESISREQGQNKGDSMEKSPPVDTALTPETLVASWEVIRGAPYNKRGEYGTQLRAARTLLTLPLRQPLTGHLLEQVYATFFDDFWKATYGELHLSHLVDTERSSGKIRLVRWLERLQRQTSARLRSSPAISHQADDLGGWERFAKGIHPDDDLQAAVRRLQAEGKLPIFEEHQGGCYV